MSRVHRLRRRVGQSATTHDRARSLAATRVDFPLDPIEAAWLEAHLGSCEACRSVAVAYDADRLALRAMRERQPVPPRDLWARTSAAIERESASRGGSRRAGSPRRRSIPLGAVSGVAVIAVVIGASVMSGGFITGPGTAPAGSTPPIAVAPTSKIPGATPMAVGAGSVEWLGTSSSGGLAYSSTKIDKVCPADRQPDCEPVNDRDSKQVDLAIRPKSISQSPVNEQAVVVGTDAAGSDSVVVMTLPTPRPTSTPKPTPSPTPPATETPTLTPEPTETPAASESATVPASGEPTPSESASTEPSTAPSASVEVTPEPTPILTPEPTVSQNLAIVSGVKVVGQSAAYSPDGAWFAFTARPSDGSAGPDIYVWRVGDQAAHVVTDDHASVFASWAGDRLIGSRIAAGAAGGAVTAKSFFIDPASGNETAIDGDAWRPSVDPKEHWAVTWDGTVKVGRDGMTPIAAEGSLVLRGRDRSGVDTNGKPADVVAGGPFAEFDVRWDETGTWLAVWLADASDPAIGRLSLLQLDPVTGELDRPHGAPRDTRALPGFSIANGRLAWATPPGQDGEGSRVQVVAWTDDAVGAVESGPVENVVVIH
jgi:hypothetical protein